MYLMDVLALKRRTLQKTKSRCKLLSWERRMSKGENNSNGSFVSIAVVPFLGTTTTQMWILPLGEPQLGDTT